MLKQCMTALLCGLWMASASAQSVNGVPISEIESEYVQIVGTAKLLSNKVTIQLDFGQATKVVGTKESQVTNADGNRMIFNSMIDALNFMSANGYEFTAAYTLTIGNQNVYHFLMRRKEE